MQWPTVLPKDKKRSVTVVPHVIEPYYTKKRAEPNLTVSNTIVEETSSEKLAKFSDILWILIRFCSSSSEQTVPGWAGWITLTSSDNHDSKWPYHRKCHYTAYNKVVSSCFKRDATAVHSTYIRLRSCEKSLWNFVAESKHIQWCSG